MATSDDQPKHYYYIYDDDKSLTAKGLSRNKKYYNQNGSFEYIKSSDLKANDTNAIRIKEILDDSTVSTNSGFRSKQKVNLKSNGGSGGIPESGKAPKPGNGPKPPGKKGLVAGFGGPLGFGLAAWTAVSSYSDARDEGHGRLSSAAHAATELILPEFLGWKTKLLLDFASFAPKAAIQGMQSVAQVGREYERAARDQSPFRTNTFVDSQQIYTMRQAGVALAEQSKYSLQQTLIGNEAKYMHR